jgi:hypothetical protein
MIGTATSVIEPAVRSGATGAPIAAAAGTGVFSRHRLFELPRQAGCLALVSASAGSAKTAPPQSWVCAAPLAECAAWVPAQGERHDPQQFWVSVADALRGTTVDAELVRPLTAAPDLDGWAVVERLLDDLAPLREHPAQSSAACPPPGGRSPPRWTGPLERAEQAGAKARSNQRTGSIARATAG